MLLPKRLILLVLTGLIGLSATPILAAAGDDAMPWAADLITAQAEAARTGKLILIHFTGERCAPCVRVERNVFNQASVGHQVGTKFVPVQINATAQPNIARQFQVTSWPTDLVLTASGQELHRMTSPQDPRAYLAELGKSVWRAQNLGSIAATPTASARQPAASLTAATQSPQANRATPSYPSSRNQAPQEAGPTEMQQSIARAGGMYSQQAAAAKQSSDAAWNRAGYAAPSGLPARDADEITMPTSSPEELAKQIQFPAQNNASRNPWASQAVQAAATVDMANPANVSPAAAAMALREARAVVAAAQQPTSTPAAPSRQPAADLYPRSNSSAGPQLMLQNHTASATTPNNQQSARIPAAAATTGVQQTSYNETEKVAAQFPPGQDPFRASDPNAAGPVMLNNPFLTKTPPAPVQARPTQPIYTAQATPQPQQLQPQTQQAPAASLQPAPIQPVPMPQVRQQIQLPLTVMQAAISPPESSMVQNVHSPAPSSQVTTGQPVVAPAPMQAPTQEMPTPALTLATPLTQPEPAAVSNPEPAQPETTQQASESTPGSGDVALPENVALDGHCCVTMHHEERWVKGDPKWGAQHRGKIFIFHSAAAQERFLSDPDKYSPLLSGYDPVVYHQTGELKTGFSDLGVRYLDMTCLFSSEESLQKFWESPWQYAQTAKQAMKTDTTVR